MLVRVWGERVVNITQLHPHNTPVMLVRVSYILLICTHTMYSGGRMLVRVWFRRCVARKAPSLSLRWYVCVCVSYGTCVCERVVCV